MTDSIAACNFFQAGHTYTREHHADTIRFLVRHVSWAPDHSYRVAHGWRLDDGGDWEPTDADDLDGWTDVTQPDAVPPAPATQAGLRDRIAEALWPLTDWDGDRLNAERAADAVLAVLPAPVDRAAVLAEAIAELETLRDTTDVNVAVYPRYDVRQRSALDDGIRRLRRAADEEQQPETQADASLLAELQQHLADHTPSCNARTDHLMRRAAWALGAPRPAHVGGNAEDCPSCTGTNPPYPFICPGPDAAAPQ